MKTADEWNYLKEFNPLDWSTLSQQLTFNFLSRSFCLIKLLAIQVHENSWEENERERFNHFLYRMPYALFSILYFVFCCLACSCSFSLTTPNSAHAMKNDDDDGDDNNHGNVNVNGRIVTKPMDRVRVKSPKFKSKWNISTANEGGGVSSMKHRVYKIYYRL